MTSRGYFEFRLPLPFELHGIILFKQNQSLTYKLIFMYYVYGCLRLSYDKL